jgi:hypothetical protein
VSIARNDAEAMGTRSPLGSSSTHAWTKATGKVGSDRGSSEVTRMAASSLGVPKTDIQPGTDSKLDVTSVVSRSTNLVPGRFPMTLLRVVSVV